MDRRAFLGTVVAVAAPLAATAQQPAGKVPHIGFLGRGERPVVVAGFRERLRERGYEESRNITITTRCDEGNDERRLTILAADLVRLKVDVIVAFTMQAGLAAKAATTTTPVVFIAGFLRDLGFSSHHTRPASNLTGFLLADDGINGKQLQLLKEMVPTATHVALLMLPGLASHENALPESLAAAKQLNLRVLVLKAITAEEIERAFATAARNPVEGALRVHPRSSGHCADADRSVMSSGPRRQRAKRARPPSAEATPPRAAERIESPCSSSRC